MVIYSLLSHNNEPDRRLLCMNPEEPITINCPYCGEPQVKVIDLGDMSGEYIEDCEVCCRPMVLKLSMSEDGLLPSVKREDE